MEISEAVPFGSDMERENYTRWAKIVDAFVLRVWSAKTRSWLHNDAITRGGIRGMGPPLNICGENTLK